MIMDYIPLIIILLSISGAIFVVVYKRRKNMALLRTVTTPFRGTWSERKLIIKLLKIGIPPITIYHDLFVEKENGGYSQIDAVVVTKVGILVFEVKDYSGWIFGKGYQNYWTQVLAYGKEKHRFYNPVLQNAVHVDSLRKRLSEVANVPFYSIIVFYGRCRLRNVNYIPNGTYIIYPNDVKSIIDSIMSNSLHGNYIDKRGVINILRNCVENGNNSEVIRRHISDMKI